MTRRNEVYSPERFTIDLVDFREPIDTWKPRIADRGRRRHLSYTLDFDTRAVLLEQEPGPGWSEETTRLHLENREKVRQGLAAHFGGQALERKVADFVAIKSKPFSVLAYHNQLFEQVRGAFVLGAYYPALVGACALGERILNHLILDLRGAFTHTPEYKHVYRKDSFDDWRVPIDTLAAWGVLVPEAVTEFRALMALRHRSIHFNVSTYATLRDDALAAILHLRQIIEVQFGTFGLKPWLIPGTAGLMFICKSWEDHPFIRAYHARSCPFVGPYVAISFEQGLQYFDHHDYGDGDWSDEEFAAVYSAREPGHLAAS
ncbi:hypothetical protein [Phenylobacterium sp. SCN 70-31]|uniref:hypothetical protein n=1 Tax=Phenylobacterium sp. SCN 70-31 TaxID=1660129 RepID=UPI0025E01E27|nr:hypothetical protein [Phenylobacterium sp. SCN 70-31]